MADIYVTLEEAANFEGIKSNTLIQRMSRNPECYITKNEPANTGGKDRVMLALSCLSTKAMRAYQNRQSEEIKQLISEAESSDGDESWYVGVDYTWYLHNYKDTFFKNVELARIIEEYLGYKGGFSKDFSEEYGAKARMSGRNFRRKVDKYLEGKRWAMEMQEMDGKNYEFYKILALCTPPKKLGQISLNDEMKAVIENIWFDPMFAANRRSQTALYRKLQDIGEKKGWILIPSYQTVNRYINELNDKFGSERYLAANGVREWKRSKMIKRKRNIALLKVMELVQGDAHTFDCWVKIVRPNGSVTAIKPYLVGLIDIRSRCLGGWAICEVPNKQIIKKCMLHMIYPKKNNHIEGVPRVLLIDNGKDWTAHTLTGRPRKERISIDAAIKGFYKSVGIEEDMRALPYQAWTKAQIERLFGTICEDFTKEFDSYTGTLTGSKTAGKVKKDIKGMLERDELISIEDFAALFDKWLNEEYHNRKHKGLKNQGEDNPRPIEVYMNAERYYKPAPPMEYAQMLLMECEERLVTSVGFNMFNRNYQHADLAPYVEKKVNVRFDPDNTDRVSVYSLDGIKVCDVDAFDGLNPLAERNDDELIEHIKDQKRQYRKAKTNLKQLNTPYEQRVETLGGRKLVLPQLSEDIQKVTAIPNDRQYKEEIKQRKNDKEKLSGYLNKQGAKALAILESLERVEGI